MSFLNNVYKCLRQFIKPYKLHQFYMNGVYIQKFFAESMTENSNKNNIVWMHIEMTGLDVEKDKIIEIGCLITDENLNIISDIFHKIIYQPACVFENMDEWCKKIHNKSGLIEASKISTDNVESVDNILLDFMKKYVPVKKCPLAGNSIHLDRLFLQKYLHRTNDYLHYRIIDVSSIKEVVRRWKPEIYSLFPKKEKKHRVIDDIKESIEELEFYRKNIFNTEISK